MSIAPLTSDFGRPALDAGDDEPLYPELHPKLPVAPPSPAGTSTPPTAASSAVATPANGGPPNPSAASASAPAAPKPIPKAVRIAPASYEVFVAQPVADDAPVPSAQPVTTPHTDSHKPATTASDALPLVAGIATPAHVEASAVDVDDPLARRAALASTGLSAWLWHIRLTLMSSGLSGLVHTVAIVALGTIALDEFVPPPPPQEALVVSVPAEKRLIDQIKPPELKAPEAVMPSVRSEGRATGSGRGSIGTNGGRGGGKLGGLQMSPVQLNANLTTGTGGTGFGTDRAYGDDMLGEVGELKKEATFFGVKAQGKSFVFVVDTSGSMAGNNRYLRCRAELLRAVNELGYGQKYFIAFFNDRTFAMPERQLVPVKTMQLEKTSQWIVHAIPSGGTEPWDAFQMGLRMKPDAIFLLTDGEFSPDTARRILNAQPNTKKIPIHTIGFESVAGEAALKAIAEATGGKYLYVP
ncbi:MAG: hypothetical protein QM775_34865 [Pirellulales bacterium]